MTLHLTRVSRTYALQVSDRLVSGALQDPAANKNLIYWARDALVTIGYTGLAYGLSDADQNMPTDEWIAQTLWGRDIERMDDGRPSMFFSRPISRWLDIGQSVELLRQKLNASMEHLDRHQRNYPFELVVAGWQETRGRRRPVLIQLRKAANATAATLERPPRYWYLPRQVALVATPDGYLSSADGAEIAEELGTGKVDQVELALVKLVRRVSAQHPRLVGPHCISTVIPPFGHGPVRVRFIPRARHSVEFCNDETGARQKVPVGFSPWIVCRNGFASPTVHAGNCEMSFGDLFKVLIEAPAPTRGVLSYMGAQHRPKGPGKGRPVPEVDRRKRT